MTQSLDALAPANEQPLDQLLQFNLPDPEDTSIAEQDFQNQLEQAWHVCDRFDLQTEIWRGRILRTIRDRQKQSGDNRGSGFLNWLKQREISKSRAYSLIELANSADSLLSTGYLETNDVNQFSKSAFIETAQSAPEVQQLISEAAHRGEQITRREVRQLSDEWVAMTSELLPEPVREKAATHTIPVRYVAPLVRQLEKLPDTHQAPIQDEVATNPDIDTVKQATVAARSLSRYLEAAAKVQALGNPTLDLELALEESLRLNCLNITADLVNQAAQLEGAIAKLFTTWKRVVSLSERLYLDSGSSTPNLRSLLAALGTLSSEEVSVQLSSDRRIGVRILPMDGNEA